MDHILRLHEFFVEGKNQQKSHVLLHITEPATEAEKSKGYFFAVCEINNGDTRQILKLQEIIDQIENEYYESPDPGGTSSFEATLGKVNPAGFSLLKDEIILNCLVGIIKQAEIIFSFYGQPVMALLYQNKQGLYQKLDLIESNRSDDDKTLFSQVIQGKISPDDFMFVGTPHIIDYFNLDRLEKIITTRPARQSSEHLERVLSELKNGYSFGGLIINLHHHVGSGQTIIKPMAPKGGSAKSLNTFFDTEKQTANILSPSMIPKINDRLKNIWRRPKTENTAPAVKVALEQTAEINSTHLRPHRADKTRRPEIDYHSLFINVIHGGKAIFTCLLKGLIWTVLLLWSAITGLINFIGLLFFIITNIQNRRQTILENWRRGWRAYKANFNQLPLATRLLLAASLAVAVIFVFSIFYIKHQQTKTAARQIFNSTLDQIKIKKDAADSALIYNDEATALSQIQAAEQLLSQLDCDIKENKDSCRAVKEQLEQIALKLRKIITAKPQILFDWSNFTGTAQLNGIVKLGAKIIAYSENTSTVFIYDILTKENKEILSPLNNGGVTAAAAPKENDYALLLYDKISLARFDPKDGLIKMTDVSFPNANVDIKGLIVYNRRLYSLDVANNTIYRHDSTKSGFNRGTDWLKDKNSDIKNGVDLTTDGDLFAQKSDGQIIKFTAGVAQPFIISGLDPILTSASQIWTYVDLDFLYVLDTAGKRLIILNKDGRIKNQIMSALLNRPVGMAVDEPNNRAYILDNNKLYQINLK